MSIKNNKKEFNKKQFLRTIKEAYIILKGAHDYKKTPPLIETKLPKGTLMGLVIKSNGRCAILYDYQKFARQYFKNEPFVQRAIAGASVAHEFRH